MVYFRMSVASDLFGELLDEKLEESGVLDGHTDLEFVIPLVLALVLLRLLHLVIGARVDVLSLGALLEQLLEALEFLLRVAGRNLILLRILTHVLPFRCGIVRRVILVILTSEFGRTPIDRLLEVLRADELALDVAILAGLSHDLARFDVDELAVLEILVELVEFLALCLGDALGEFFLLGGVLRGILVLRFDFRSVILRLFLFLGLFRLG